MKIPKEIQIVGRKYKIKFDNADMEQEDSAGMIRYRIQEITLKDKYGDQKRSPECIKISFLHELIHAMLYAINEHQLRNEENFCNKLSEVLYQVVKQIEG